jgi:hypothetical protein
MILCVIKAALNNYNQVIPGTNIGGSTRVNRNVLRSKIDIEYRNDIIGCSMKSETH